MFVAAPFMSKAGGYPVVTLTAASIDGTIYGYAAVGGYWDASGSPGGSLSATLLPGATTTDLASDGASQILLAFSGDVTALLAGVTAIKLNGTSYHISGSPSFTGLFTQVSFTGSFTAGTYAVQLV